MAILFGTVGFLVLAGLIVLSSISAALFLKQLIFAILGVILIFIFTRVDWRLILNYRWFISGFYLFGLSLLLLTHFTAPLIRNVRSWLVLGPLTLQPAEFMKLGLILVYAQYFSRRHLSIARWKTILVSFAIFVLPAVLVAIQPALGSAVVLFGIWFGFLLFSGLPRQRLLIALLVFLIAGFFFWNLGMEDYQRSRITNFFYPEQNLLSINYSSFQSKIAIGSAGFWGKGYGQGTQTHLGFLSEPANDFILASLIEEWGIAAGILIVVAFLLLIFKILSIAGNAQQNFERFICLGTAIVFGLQFVFNAGSALGLLPVVGLSFPFLSYGGSSLLTNFFLLAIIRAIADQT